MVWGGFHKDRNAKLGDSLLSLQKRLVGVIAGKRGRYHSDPLFAKYGILKVSDLYRLQLRTHAWKLWNRRLPGSQLLSMSKVSEKHRHNTRAAASHLAIQTQDFKSMGYRIPKEWESLSKELRETRSLTGFKRRSKNGFLANYRAFKCDDTSCFVCGPDGSAAQ